MPWYRLPKSGQAMYFPGRMKRLEEVPDPTVPAAVGSEASEPEIAKPQPPAPKRKRSKA